MRSTPPATSCFQDRRLILLFLGKGIPGGNAGAVGQTAVFHHRSDLSWRQFTIQRRGNQLLDGAFPPASAPLGPCSELIQQANSGLPCLTAGCRGTAHFLRMLPRMPTFISHCLMWVQFLNGDSKVSFLFKDQAITATWHPWGSEIPAD